MIVVDRNRFWNALEAHFTHPIYPHVKNIFHYSRLDNIASLVDIYSDRFLNPPGPGFEFREVENEVNSDDYLASIPPGANEINYYGRLRDEFSNGFRFSVGDKRLIRQIVTAVGEISQKTRKTQLKFWQRTITFCPLQPHNLSNPQKSI